jgi:hypothetical protein
MHDFLPILNFFWTLSFMLLRFLGVELCVVEVCRRTKINCLTHPCFFIWSNFYIMTSIYWRIKCTLNLTKCVGLVDLPMTIGRLSAI